MPRIFGNEEPSKTGKSTRQGMGRGTKWGTKPAGKGNKKALTRYKKKYRGQGKR